MIKNFWRWLCIFAYRRAGLTIKEKPTGLPFNRDPEDPCSAFEPRKTRLGEWSDCQTDGHYLCRECVHNAHRGDEP